CDDRKTKGTRSRVPFGDSYTYHVTLGIRRIWIWNLGHYHGEWEVVHHSGCDVSASSFRRDNACGKVVPLRFHCPLPRSRAVVGSRDFQIVAAILAVEHQQGATRQIHTESLPCTHCLSHTKGPDIEHTMHGCAVHELAVQIEYIKT